MGCDGKTQTCIHAGGIALYGSLDELLQTGKTYDFVQFAVDFRPAHAEDGTVQEDIFAAREVRVKPSPDFDQGRQATPHFDGSTGRDDDTREQLEQRALARAVVPDYPKGLALPNLEIDVPQRPEFLGTKCIGPFPNQSRDEVWNK